MEEAYINLKEWIEVSLDLFKNDLLSISSYLFRLDNADNVDSAKNIFAEYKNDFPDKNEEIKVLESIKGQQHIHENNMAVGFKTKYFLVMGRYAYDLLINFIE